MSEQGDPSFQPIGASADGRATDSVPGNAARWDSEEWLKHDESVLDLSLSISLDELRESAKPFDSIKTRAATVFAAVTAGVAFLVGSSLRDVQPDSLNDALLVSAVSSFIVFGACSFITLFPGKRKLYLEGMSVRDEYFRGSQGELQTSHTYGIDHVKWELIENADTLTRANVAKLRLLRWTFLAMLVTAATSITLWSLLVASAEPAV